MKTHLLVCLVPLLVPGVADATSQKPADAAVKQDQDGQWNTWRGPGGVAVARSGNPPTEWSEDKNIRWKTRIPGDASSSPIVWKDRIYLTTAIEVSQEDQEPEEPERRGGQRGGQRRGGFFGGRQLRAHEYAAVAVNRKNGDIVWQKTLKRAKPHERMHTTASQASASPVTDGEHIYALFGSQGLHCLDMAGNVKWSKDLGRMRIAGQFGEGASPALHGDKLVVNWDHEGDSWIAVFRKTDGKEIWRKPRDERTSWSTPIVAPRGTSPAATRSCGRVDAAARTRPRDWSMTATSTSCSRTPVA
jgi:outer membrane protein assembly factor BamB